MIRAKISAADLIWRAGRHNNKNANWLTTLYVTPRTYWTRRAWTIINERLCTRSFSQQAASVRDTCKHTDVTYNSSLHVCTRAHFWHSAHTSSVRVASARCDEQCQAWRLESHQPSSRSHCTYKQWALNYTITSPRKRCTSIVMSMSVCVCVWQCVCLSVFLSIP